MNKYESVIIINPSVDAEKIKTLVERFTDLINNAGKVEKVDELGNYIIINFEAKPELIAELERNYRITDEVLKFIVVKVEE